MSVYACTRCGEAGLGMYGHYDSETGGFTCDKKKADQMNDEEREILRLTMSDLGADLAEAREDRAFLRAELTKRYSQIELLKKELEALKEVFGRDGNYLKQEAEKDDARNENLTYRGKTTWAWWAKAHAYGCMVHGINPILGTGEGEQTADAARRVVAERDALKKENVALKTIERTLWENVNKVFGTKYPTQMNEGESARWTGGGQSAAQWGEGAACLYCLAPRIVATSMTTGCCDGERMRWARLHK